MNQRADVARGHAGNRMEHGGVTAADVAEHRVDRSRIPKVIGILLVLAGIVGLVGSLPGLQILLVPAMLVLMGKYYIALVGLIVVALLLSGWLIFIGIELIRYRDRGRRQFTYFAVVFLIVSTLSGWLLQGLQQHPYITIDDASNAALAESIDSPMRLIIPLLILVLVGTLLNREKVKKSLG